MIARHIIKLCALEIARTELSFEIEVMCVRIIF